MELVCSEVGKKIRSAIKVRLMELGKTVDDELIDYIMVMAANKKEETQMAKDLQPFLEEDTNKFTSWLQKVLKKLEQITVTVTDNEYKVAATVNKKSKSVTADSLKKKVKDGDSKDKKKKLKVAKDLNDTPKKLKVVKATGKTPSEVSPDSKSKGKVKSVVKLKKTVKEEPTIPLESFPSTSGLQSSVVVVRSESVSERKMEAATAKPREPVMMTSDVDEDEDDDFINIKTDLIEEEELLAEEQPNGSKVSRVEKMSSDHDSESSRSRPSYRNNPAITTAELRARRSVANRSRNESPPVQAVIRSQVIAKKRKSPSPPPRVSVMSRIGAVLKRKAEEEEEVKPKSVASVVRIKPRTTLPPEARPSKFLLLKAINEAQKSITTARQKSVEEEEEADSRPKLFTKNLKNRLGPREKIQVTLRNLAAEKKYDLEEDDDEMNEGDAYVPELTTSKNQPSFLITLDGYEEYSNKYLRATAEDIEMLQEEGVEMEFIDEGQLADENAPSKPKRKRIVFTPEPEEPVATEPVKKTMERCKFWPACRQGDSCGFHHPSTTCNNFPNCNFGDRCLYIHPNCKFDAACTRKDCPFTHASPRTFTAVVAIPKFVPAPVVRPAAPVKPVGPTICRFYPGCTNMNCRFFHPKPCRFGASCKSFGCIFSHPDVAPITKLKWVNTASV
ncbi:zinc finger CCCH domain-containing protein 14 isoform X2 [Cloeon dipterum]|uniref:zinc finger CCCH domain-containing protein 14 isoform X2 n=1 Tax=Cloeon dipterum TaxID=197152 RepID=UPI0032204EC2